MTQPSQTYYINQDGSYESQFPNGDKPVSDSSPDPFTIPAVTGAALSTPVTSANITPTGYTSAPISVGAGAEYSIDDGAFTATAGTITYPSTVKVRVTSSGSNSTGVTGTLMIGDKSADFVVTTVSEAGATWRGNEPAGMSSNSYSDKDNYTLEEGWYVAGAVSLEETDSPYSVSGNALRVTYPVGFDDGYSPGIAGNYEFSGKEIYFCFAWKVSDNWQNQSGSTNKMMYMPVDGFGGGGDPGFLSYQTNDGIGEIMIRQQGSGVVIKPGSLLTPNVSNYYPAHGEEVLVEVYLKTNSAAGVLDGIGKLWINGALTTDYDDVEWVNAGFNWSALTFDPIWGGNDGDLVTEEMYQEISRLWVSYKA